MEIPSREITKYIQEKYPSSNWITIKDPNQIEEINDSMNKNHFLPNISSYVDKGKNICHDEKRFDGHRSDVFTRKLNFPHRIDFNWREGSFLDENTFCPQIYLTSEIDDDEMDFKLKFLKTKFISAFLETNETPKIAFPKPCTRINLNEFFPGTDDVLICFKSEIPIISRLFAAK